MAQPVVECVPNFSEGRNTAVIKEITDAIEAVSGVRLLDVDPGANTNRTVVTFVGSPEAVEEAAFRAVARAAQLIDMREHHGEHPRMGATDVVPFVPVADITMEECAEIARRVGKRIGEELDIPVFLYEHAASRPERRNLARVRSGEYEGMAEKLKDPEWKPDFGPAALNPGAGVTAVGAREFLIAYNVNLNTTDRRYANDIAYVLRERGRWKRVGNTEPFYYKGEIVRFPADGRYPCGPCDFVGASFEELEAHYREVHGGDLRARYESLEIDPEHPSGPVFDDGIFRDVKAIGWVIEDYGRAQISMNLTNYKVSPPHVVLEAARDEARKRGMAVTGSELVGVIPFEAIRQAGRFYLRPHEEVHRHPGVRRDRDRGAVDGPPRRGALRRRGEGAGAAEGGGAPGPEAHARLRGRGLPRHARLPEAAPWPRWPGRSAALWPPWWPTCRWGRASSTTATATSAPSRSAPRWSRTP